MRRLAIAGVVLAVLVACGPEPGREGGRCLDDGTCGWDLLACGPDGRCHFCGREGQMCCQRQICTSGYVCGPDGRCQDCGVEGQLCCAEDTCLTWRFCGSDGLCHRCGGYGDPCCADNWCGEGLLCRADGECDFCGGADQPCCDARTCDPGYLCGSDGLCRYCGEYDQPCCEGDRCVVGFVCGAEGICEMCGGLGEPCCEASRCDGWLGCLDGACRSPFEADPAADVSICTKARLGGGDEGERDWCYWYAAYHKADTALCEPIEWDEMRKKCLDGADPGDYLVLPTFR